MPLSAQQLLEPISAADIRSTSITVLQSLGLQPQNWAQGGIASSVLTVASSIMADLSLQLSNAIAQQWNPTASGGGLQLLSQYFYGITPPQATFANGTVTLRNIGGGVYTFAAGQATFGNSVANAQGQYAQYVNTASFSLVAGTPSVPTVITVPVECTTIGSLGNANPGFVSLLITQMLGVSCTNLNPIVGSDGLTDAQLRALNANSVAVRGTAYGPRQAYQYAIQTALNSVTGSPVNVNRWSITPSSHYGTVTIYVASPAGPVITTDLQGISTNIDLLCRPDCVTVLPGLPGYPSAPASASTVNYTPNITVYVLVPSAPVPTSPINPQFFLGPPSAAALANIAATAVENWFESTSNTIGGLTASDDLLVNFTGIFQSGITGLIGAAINAVPGCTVLSTRFATEGDLPLSPGEVAVWGGTITVIIQVAN